MRDQGRRLRLGEDVREVGDAEARVDRHVDGADPRQREHGEDPLRAVGEPERDLVARDDADVDEAPGESVDLGEIWRNV